MAGEGLVMEEGEAETVVLIEEAEVTARSEPVDRVMESLLPSGSVDEFLVCDNLRRLAGILAMTRRLAMFVSEVAEEDESNSNCCEEEV